jgi:mRNA interferase YafQ
MLEIRASNRFRKDLKLIARRGLDLDLLDAVVMRLCNMEQLEPKYRDHPLTGDYAGFRECHILPDWLLIYRIEEGELYLFLSRTGTHSDLF